MTQKPKALLISYVYPPAGGGGSPRLVRWTRALFEAGFEPVVLTVKSTYIRGEDQSLIEEIKDIARIERTSSLDPKRVFYLLNNLFKSSLSSSLYKKGSSAKSSNSPGALWKIFSSLRNWALVPDEMIGWVPFALFRGWRIIRREKPVVIITSSSPHSVQLVGILLKKIFHLPWLADFRDAWARHPYYPYPTNFHRWLNRTMEEIAVKNADAITLAYGLDSAQKAYPQFKNKFRLLHNGFNEKNFTEVQAMNLSGFNLVYLGAFYGTQTPIYFFQALKNLLSERPELKDELKVTMIGAFNPEHLKMVSDYGLENSVCLKQYMPHNQITRWMLSADALLLFLGSEIKESMVIPGKVFEYIRAGVWILAMIPEGETAEILRNAGGALIVPGNDLRKIQEALLELYQYYKQGKKPVQNQEYIWTKEETQLKKEMSKLILSLTCQRQS